MKAGGVRTTGTESVGGHKMRRNAEETSPLADGRVCTQCGTWKPAGEFYLIRKKKYRQWVGLESICKACKISERRERRNPAVPSRRLSESPRCARCNRSHWSLMTRDGLCGKCYRAETRRKNKAERTRLVAAERSNPWIASFRRAIARFVAITVRREYYQRDPWLARLGGIVSSHRIRRRDQPITAQQRGEVDIATWEDGARRAIVRYKQQMRYRSRGDWVRVFNTKARNWNRKIRARHERTDSQAVA